MAAKNKRKASSSAKARSKSKAVVRPQSKKSIAGNKTHRASRSNTHVSKKQAPHPPAHKSQAVNQENPVRKIILEKLESPDEKNVRDAYLAFQGMFTKAYENAKEKRDMMKLQKLERYKNEITLRVQNYNKDPKSVNSLVEAIKDGLNMVSPPQKQLLVKPSISGKENNASQNVLDRYPIAVDKTKIEVEIVKEGAETKYFLRVPEINAPTLTLLSEVRNELISATTISMRELVDPEAFSGIKDKFMNEASEIIKKKLPRIEKETEEFLIGKLIQDMLGLGKIEFLINDPSLEEIVITSSKEPIKVYTKKHGWLDTNIIIEKEDDILNYSNIIARRVGRQINVLNPLLDAHLVGGDRINAVLYPINTKGNTITIRKFARDPFTVIDLIKGKTCSLESVALIWLAMEYEMNILISGGTASGKTSFLNACLPFIPPNQRIISIEDTRELMLPEYLYWTPLVTRLPNPEGKGEVNMLHLLVNSLRMRPDRIILGEMRKHEEAMVLFEAMHTGHSVYATLHADSAAETISRLVHPPLSVPANLLKSVNLNIVMFRDRKRGIRRMLQMAEFEAYGDHAKSNLLYRWSPEEDKIVSHGESLRFFEDLSRNTGMSQTEINRNLDEKKRILEWLMKNGIRSLDEFGKTMNTYYRNKNLLLEAVNKNNPKLLFK